MEDQVVPNCRICQWASFPSWMTYHVFPVCDAQGSQKISSCYNSDVCKKLYKPKETKVEEKE